MTRTPDEIRKPLPGQLVFRFMRAEPGPDERPAPGQEEADDRADRSRRGPPRQGQEFREGPSVQTAGGRLER